MRPSKSAPAILGEALGDFRRSAPAMIAYEVLFRLATLAAIAPLISWTLRTIVGTTGRYAVGNTELVSFLLSPAGLAAAFAAVALSLVAAFGQLAGVILIADAAGRGRHLSAIGALRAVALRVPGMLRIGVRLVGRLALVALPALAVIGLAYLTLWSRSDLYYLTTARPPAFWAGAAVAGVAVAASGAVAAGLLLRWLNSLPILLTEGKGARESLRESAARTSGRGRRNLAVLALWAAGVSVLGLVAAGLFHSGSEAVLARIPASLSAAIPALGALLAVHLVLIEAVDVAGNIALALVIYRISREDAPTALGASEAGIDGFDASPRARIPRRKILAVVLAMVVLAAVSCLGMLATIGVSPEVTITAHRGDSRSAPENTLAAIRAAIESGADGAEIDVQLTADGAVVVIHDEDLKRLANDPRRVAGIEFEELRRLDVGSWFGPEFRGERVPTLDEVLEAAGDRLILNIELKMPRGRSDPAPLVRGVLDALDRNRARGRCVISSLSAAALAEVRRRAPDLRIGFIIFEALGDPSRLDVDFLSVREAIATDDLIGRARRRGLAVHVWTVNDPNRLAGLVDRGVADVLTSDPSTMVARREELEASGDLDRLLLWYRRILGD